VSRSRPLTQSGPRYVGVEESVPEFDADAQVVDSADGPLRVDTPLARKILN